MSGRQNGDSAAGHFIDQCPELAAGNRVNTCGGFIQEEHGRLVDDGAGQGQALPPCAGEIGCALFFVSLQPGHGTKFRDAVFEPRPRYRIQTGVKIEVFSNSQVIVQGKFLGHISDPLLDFFGLGGDIVTQNSCGTGCGLENSTQHAHGSGLASAVWTEQAKYLAARDGEG